MSVLEPLWRWSVDFDAPRYLLLFALLPVFWFVSRRSLSSLGNWRRRLALGVRLAIASLFIVALAEPNWQALIRRLSVMFVVDASNSVQRSELNSALKYVGAAATQRDVTRGDRAGVVVFGRDAAVEVPPVERRWQVPRIESHCDPQYTNLQSALQLAEASLPTDSGRRVVIVSDGNENVGQAMPQAQRMLASGIGFDCVPISYERHGEIAVDKVVAPGAVRRHTPFTVSIVLDNLSTQTTPGKLKVDRELNGERQTVSEEAVSLGTGKRVFTLPQEVSESGMATYEARFIPDRPADDAHSENNSATAFCHVSGNGHILLIEDASQVGRFDSFVSLLRSHELEVTVRDTRHPFDSLADLQEFDCVILADVARVSGEGDAGLTQFSDEQIHALVQNTEHFGCGVVVLGGPNSYGPGGWANTELEKALPVDCQIKNAKVNPTGALMLVIDTSGSMQGEKIAWSKAAAIAASQMLGDRDFLGVVTFDTEPHWIVPIQRNSLRERTKARIDRIGADGGTDMMPALSQAYKSIQGVDASLKHVVVLTDGQTAKSDFDSLVSSMHQKGITTTGIAVGRDADRVLLGNIAQRGGGKFYQVLSPNAIPRIFMREARRVSLPLIFEDPNGIATQVITPGEPISGIKGALPPVTGFVLTTVKDSSLVDVLVATPRQPQPTSTILATWQYGLGRAVALTTDVGQRWAASWPAWGDFDKLMLQTVRWSMRSRDVSDKFAISTDAHDGVIDVVLNAIDSDDQILGTMGFSGTAVLPDGSSQSFPIEQDAPGRYRGKLATSLPGNYFLAVAGLGRSALLRSAASVPATAEFDRLTSNDGFLADIAEGVPHGGERGQLIRAPHGIDDTPGLLATNVFRPGVPLAKSRSAFWPLLLVLSSVLFAADVFCRRVQLSFEWIAILRQRFLAQRGQSTAIADTARMERLRASKTGATAHFGAADEAKSFDPADFVAAASNIVTPQSTATPPNDAPASAAPDKAESEFTSRLLDVKKRVRDQRKHLD
ncbi:MAG TPA: VWA domain-containing protein [Lacipirellulaceae bacterium]|nr:VWA domain-containing protein [Lacipirellulaceae bacterium]